MENIAQKVEQLKEENERQMDKVKENYDNLKSKMVVVIAIIVAIPSAFAFLLQPVYKNIMSLHDFESRLENFQKDINGLNKQIDSLRSQGSCSPGSFFSC